MKKLALTLTVLFCGSFAFAQQSIKINGDYFKSGKILEHSASTANVNLPESGSNKKWDYSGLTGGNALSTNYSASTNSNFSKKAIVGPVREEYFTSDETYNSQVVYDQDSKGIFYAGTITPRYASPLAEVTYNIYLDYFMNTLGMDAATAAAYAEQASIPDSLIIFSQSSKVSSPDYLLLNPTKKDSKWSTTYTKTINFSLTLGFLQWNKVSCKEVAYTTVSNEVVGYGDLKLPKGSGEGKTSDDVLMIKRSVKTVDSIFISGYDNKNDPLYLFYAFDAPQGETTYEDYSESFYTKNSWSPVLTFDFGTDNTFGTLSGITYHINSKGGNEQESVSVVKQNKSLFNHVSDIQSGMIANPVSSTIISPVSVYPNPAAAGSNINCQIYKTEEGTWNLNVCNMMGQVVHSVPVTGTGILNVQVPLNPNENSGMYMLNVINSNGQVKAASKFNIAN